MIIFWLHGGKKLGWGHCQRMIRYAKKHFSNTKNIKFWTNHDVKIVHYIKNKGYNVKTLDSKESLINRLKHDKPNKIYIDIKENIDDELEIIKQEQIYITLFDNITDTRFLADENIYPTPLFNKNDLDWTGYKGIIKGGWEETLLSESILELKHKSSPVNRSHILITFGGTDPNEITLLVMKACAEIDKTIPIKVVIGPSFKHSNKIKTLNKEVNQRFELIENCNDLAPHIATAKTVVTAIGITLFEAQYLNISCIVISNYASDKTDEEKLKKWSGVTVLARYDTLNRISELTYMIKQILKKQQK